MISAEVKVKNKLDHAEVDFLGDFSNTIRIVDKIIFTVCKTYICMYAEYTTRFFKIVPMKANTEADSFINIW